MPVACAGCGQRWYGIDRAHCSTCHRTFTEVDFFDRHRVDEGCRSPASLGMINDRAKSQIPGLGYTVTYAVGNTLLTIWGMVLVMLLT